MKVLLSLALALVSPFAFANEIDNEDSVKNVSERAKELPRTLVMRVNESTKQVEVVHLDSELAAEEGSVTQLANLNFATVEAEKAYSKESFMELDNDKTASGQSWYFYYGYGYGYGYPYYYRPYYNYYGYNYYYYPYYNYNYYGWNYYYYRCW